MDYDVVIYKDYDGEMKIATVPHGESKVFPKKGETTDGQTPVCYDPWAEKYERY